MWGVAGKILLAFTGCSAVCGKSMAKFPYVVLDEDVVAVCRFAGVWFVVYALYQYVLF